jgi:predicted RNase H-like nuclease (RuvC/YqgF family)
MARGEDDPEVIEELQAKVKALKADNASKAKRIRALEIKRDALLAEMSQLQDALEAALADDANVATLRIRVRSLRARIDAIKSKVEAMAADIADD